MTNAARIRFAQAPEFCQKRGKVGSVRQCFHPELDALEVASFDRCVERSSADTEQVKCRQRRLQGTPPHREFLLQAQAIPRHRHPLRQNRQKFPRRNPPRGCYHLAQLSTGPRSPSFNRLPSSSAAMRSEMRSSRGSRRRAAMTRRK